MEVELKYSIPDESTARKIWDDEWLFSIEEPETRAQDRFSGAYYDTAGHKLLNNHIAFRVRMEGKLAVACLKWSGGNEGALHKREELNVTLGDRIPDEISLGCFGESGIGERAIELVGDEPLEIMMEVDVLRRHVRVDTGSGLHEVSIDSGAVRAAGRSSPILELEVELYQGDEEDLLETGRILAEKYGLEPEHRSKFVRGLELLKAGMDTDPDTY